MTPTPEQSAKRVPTPRTDALLAASASFTDAEQRDILKVGLQQLETELQQLRLAADGKESQLLNITANARRLYHHYCQSNADTSRITTDLSGIIRSLEGLAAAYRAAGEGAPNDTGTSKE